MELQDEMFNEQMERRLKIIGYAKLKYLTRRTVDDLFEGLYKYLIESERYEECAIIKKKQDEYRKYIDKIKA